MTTIPMDIAYTCVKHQKRFFVCQGRAPPPPKHQMRLYVCHQMRLCVCHQMRPLESATELASLARFLTG